KRWISHPARSTSDNPHRLPDLRHRSSLRKSNLNISRRLQFALPSAKLANKVKGRANLDLSFRARKADRTPNDKSTKNQTRKGRIMAITPTQRHTHEWFLLILALLIVGAICVPLW